MPVRSHAGSSGMRTARPTRDRGVEIEQPRQTRVRFQPAGRGIADEDRLELLRVGADDQIVGDGIAERLAVLCADDEADDEPLRHDARPRHRSGHRVGPLRADVWEHETGGEGRGGVVPVLRPQANEDEAAARLAVILHQPRPGAFDRRLAGRGVGDLHRRGALAPELAAGFRLAGGERGFMRGDGDVVGEDADAEFGLVECRRRTASRSGRAEGGSASGHLDPRSAGAGR